jgi:hypothetical protein
MAETGLAANKKGAQLRGSPIVFLDESGFMLQPVRRRTWAPSGQTPVQRAWDRHDRLSAVGLIGVSPSRHRLSLYFHLVPENGDTDQLIWLLRLLHRHYRRHVLNNFLRRPAAGAESCCAGFVDCTAGEASSLSGFGPKERLACPLPTPFRRAHSTAMGLISGLPYLVLWLFYTCV